MNSVVWLLYRRLFCCLLIISACSSNTAMKAGNIENGTLRAKAAVNKQQLADSSSAQRLRHLSLASSAFKDGQALPQQYTGDGQDISPPLTWTGIPATAKSLAIVCFDPDAPSGTWYHWLLFNLPASTTQLQTDTPKESNLADGSRQGLNDFHKIGYNGPAPPPGALHHYHFRILALDAKLDLQPEVDKNMFSRAAAGHILSQSEIVATYRR